MAASPSSRAVAAASARRWPWPSPRPGPRSRSPAGRRNPRGDVERVRAAGSEGLAIIADATSEADASGWSATRVERFGRIDIVVNAVGGGAGKVLHAAEAYPRDDWDWIMELNVRSTVVPTQAAVRQMIAQGGGGSGPQHLVGPREPRHQRRLLGLRRGEGRDQLADPPVGDRVGQARHPGQRHHADLRRHAAGRDAARRPDVQGRHRRADPAGTRRRDATTWSGRRSSCAPTPRRS